MSAPGSNVHFHPSQRKPYGPNALILRWIARILLATGVVLLAWVAGVAIQARFYQASVTQYLKKQRELPQRPASPVELELVEGQTLGRMEIPRLGLSVGVFQGTQSKTLRIGAGHIEGTAIPGEAGNSGIAAHRDTFFRPLENIRTNDEIQIETARGFSHYQVDSIRIVLPDDVAVLEPTAESGVTLVTCYPFYFVGAAPKRFIVHAHKTSANVQSKP
jgi:sortase A